MGELLAVKRVLVTGASGFVGRAVVDALLASGETDVHVVSRATAVAVGGTTAHAADLFDEREAAALIARVRPSHLLHLAWYAEPGKFWTSLSNVPWLRASLRLIELFAEHGGTRVVSAGTCAEYDWSSGWCVEDVTPLRPSTLYGASKAALTLAAEAWCRQAGVSYASGRIFFLHGPFEPEPRLVPFVVLRLLAGERAATTKGDQARDLLHVDDCARAFVALLSSDVEGAVNIGSGEPLPIKDVIMKVANRIGRPDLVDLGALSDRAGEPPLIAANIDRLRDQVGWRPRLTLDEGLDATIRWWQANR